MKSSGVEWIGEIPEDWDVTRSKNIFTQRSSRGNDVEEQLAATQQHGMYPQKLLEGVVQVKEDTDLQQFKTVHKNDYVISLRSFQGGFEMSDYEGVCSPAYQVFYNTIPISYRYYKYLFKSDGFISKMNSLTVGIREGKNIQYKDFSNSPIIIPPKSTQQRIASYLDKKCSKIEETIQNQQQVIEKLKAYKQSLITEAVTGKIKIQNGKVCGKYENYKDSGVEWIGKIPSEWEVGKFGRFAQVKSNLVDPNLYLEYPQIAPDNIGKGSGKLIDWQTVKDSGVISWNHLFFKGQIVYSKIRPTLNKLIIAPFDGLCSADMYPIETNIHKQFFVYMMLSQYFVEQVGLITRDRVKMPKINQNELSGILITVPTKEEQKEISDYLDKKCTAIDTAIEQKQNLIEKLTEYKKSLIYECVTGKKEI